MRPAGDEPVNLSPVLIGTFKTLHRARGKYLIVYHSLCASPFASEVLALILGSARPGRRKLPVGGGLCQLFKRFLVDAERGFNIVGGMTYAHEMRPARRPHPPV